MNSEITRLILFPFILYTPEIDLNFLKSSFFSIFGNVALKCEKIFVVQYSRSLHPSNDLTFIDERSLRGRRGTLPHGNQQILSDILYVTNIFAFLLENDQLESYCSSFRPFLVELFQGIAYLKWAILLTKPGLINQGFIMKAHWSVTLTRPDFRLINSHFSMENIICNGLQISKLCQLF